MNDKRRRKLHWSPQSQRQEPRILSLLNDTLASREAADAEKAFYKRLEELEATKLHSSLFAGEPDDGPGFSLRWPLSDAAPVSAPFSQLDRRTQFYVLFSEWQRRAQEGQMELTTSQLGAAERTFEECLDRARQLSAAKLEARSLELLAQVAESKGDLVTATQRRRQLARRGKRP